MQLLDGHIIARRIEERVRTAIAASGRHPRLASVLVGDDRASRMYLALKERACARVGIAFALTTLQEAATTEDVIDVILQLNDQDDVHGILVQLPLPEHLDPDPIIETMDPAKDVDGFHPVNLEALERGEAVMFPVLVKAVLALLEESGTALAGKHVVFMSKSDVFMRPFQTIFTRMGATCDRTETVDAAVTQQADVLVSALGQPHIVTGDVIREGAVLIDIGITPTATGVMGDVDSESVEGKASWLTPVPGGVGPVTVAFLLENTARAADISFP